MIKNYYYFILILFCSLSSNTLPKQDINLIKKLSATFGALGLVTFLTTYALNVVPSEFQKKKDELFNNWDSLELKDKRENLGKYFLFFNSQKGDFPNYIKKDWFTLHSGKLSLDLIRERLPTVIPSDHEANDFKDKILADGTDKKQGYIPTYIFSGISGILLYTYFKNKKGLK